MPDVGTSLSEPDPPLNETGRRKKERKKQSEIRITTEREVGGEEFAACYPFYSVLSRRVCVRWSASEESLRKLLHPKIKPCLHTHTNPPASVL